MIDSRNLEYAGFWVRVGACLIDTLILVAVSFPILYLFYGQSYLNNEISGSSPIKFITDWILPLIATVLFWTYKSATPGKSAFSLRVLDERTGRPLTTPQALARYFGYFVSMLTLGIGVLWIAFDPKKQSFHDKIASTVVVRDINGGTKPVEFD